MATGVLGVAVVGTHKIGGDAAYDALAGGLPHGDAVALRQGPQQVAHCPSHPHLHILEQGDARLGGAVREGLVGGTLAHEDARHAQTSQPLFPLV